MNLGVGVSEVRRGDGGARLPVFSSILFPLQITSFCSGLSRSHWCLLSYWRRNSHERMQSGMSEANNKMGLGNSILNAFFFIPNFR